MAFFRKAVSMAVMPTKLTKLSKKQLQTYEAFLQENERNFSIDTNKEVKNEKSDQLETIAVKPKNKKPEAIVLHVLGNGEKFQNTPCINEIFNDSDKLNAISIGFNPRGVQGSGGKLTQKSHLKDDLDSVFNHFSEKYPNLPIIVKAHSIGGGYSSEWLAEADQNKSSRVCLLWLGRTFSYLESVVSKSEEKGFLGKIIDWADWNFAPGKDVKNLIEKGVNVVVIDAENDPVISSNSQLAKYLCKQKVIDSENKYETELLFSPKVISYLETVKNALSQIKHLKRDESYQKYKDFADLLGLNEKILNGVSIDDIESAILQLKKMKPEDASSPDKVNTFVPKQLQSAIKKFDKHYGQKAIDSHNCPLDSLVNAQGKAASDYFVDNAKQNIKQYQLKEDKQEEKKFTRLK